MEIGMDEKGNVRADWYVEAEMGKGRKEATEGEEGLGCKMGLGTAATVWDGAVAGVYGGLRTAPSDRTILIPSDS